MHEIPVVLRHHALHLEQNWHEDEKDVQKAADFLREAADEIDRLRAALVDIRQHTSDMGAALAAENALAGRGVGNRSTFPSAATV